jgi:hypothetical protein
VKEDGKLLADAQMTDKKYQNILKKKVKNRVF